MTLQGIAEGLSAAGVPVFVANVKSDLAGLAMAGSPVGKLHELFAKRAAEIGQSDWANADNPVMFWDFGEQGHPVRTTISEMGPLLLARLMGLNETQEKVTAREAAKPSMTEKLVQSAARSAACSFGRQLAGRMGGRLVRGILGSLFK